MEIAAAAPLHPYRNRPSVRAPNLSGRSRRLAAHGVTLVLVCAICRWLALLVSPVAVIAAEVLLVLGTWLFTLRCQADHRVTRALAWALRILVAVDSGFAIATALRLTSWTAISPGRDWLALVVAPSVVLLFLASRLHSYGLSQLAKRVVTFMALCAGSTVFVLVGDILSTYLAVLVVVTCFAVYLCGWLWGFALMLRVRNILLVRAQEWWLDVEALPRLEWTSVAHLADGRVEIAGPRHTACWFDGYADASAWLTQNGLCSRDQVLVDGLVEGGPARSLAIAG